MATATNDIDDQTTVAIGVGAVLTLVGVFGFSDLLVSEAKILGIFGITALHNAVHLLTGLVLVVGGMVAGGTKGEQVNRYLGVTYLLVFVVGVVGVLAGISFVTGAESVQLHIGWADNVLHLAIGGLLAGMGYGLTSSTP